MRQGKRERKSRSMLIKNRSRPSNSVYMPEYGDPPNLLHFPGKYRKTDAEPEPAGDTGSSFTAPAGAFCCEGSKQHAPAHAACTIATCNQDVCKYRYVYVF